jgi:hypothetical protein
MSARWHALWLAAVLGVGNGVAHAQQAAPDDEAPPQYAPVQQEELYRAALRASAEGRLEDAVALLVRFIDKEPRHAGAVLELALTQCELGNTAEAMRLFDDIGQRFDPPPGILEVIATHRASGCQHRAVRPASWLVSLGRGHDSNVNQGASNPSFTLGSGDNQGQYELDPEFRPHADSFNLLSGSYVRPLTTSGTLALLQGYVRRHDHQSAQDSASLLAGLEHSWNLGRWRTRLTGVLGTGMLDGKIYQRQQQLQLRAAPPISLPANWDLALATNISHVSYATRSNYDGNTFELSTLLTYRSKRDQVQLTVSGLRDHGSDSRPGGNRDGWFGNAQWYTLLRPGLYAEASLTRQHWQSAQAYSPGLIDLARRQDTSTARAAAQWYFRPNVSLQLEGRLVRNRENISLFQYNSRALQLSMRWDNF